MIMANKDTFGGWLHKQEGRADEVGHVARYWASIKDNYPRVRALPSIEVKMREAGALDEGAPTNEWWGKAIAEFRGTDSPIPQVSAVPQEQPQQDPAIIGHPEITGFMPQEQVRGIARQADQAASEAYMTQGSSYEQLTPAVEATLRLELIDAKLDWLHEALTSEPGSPFPPWPRLAEPEAEQLTWDRLHELADFEAEQQ